MFVYMNESLYCAPKHIDLTARSVGFTGAYFQEMYHDWHLRIKRQSTTLCMMCQVSKRRLALVCYLCGMVIAPSLSPKWQQYHRNVLHLMAGACKWALPMPVLGALILYLEITTFKKPKYHRMCSGQSHGLSAILSSLQNFSKVPLLEISLCTISFCTSRGVQLHRII